MLTRLGSAARTSLRHSHVRLLTTTSIQLLSAPGPSTRSQEQPAQTQTNTAADILRDNDGQPGSDAPQSNPSPLPIPSETQAHPFAGKKEYADNQELNNQTKASSSTLLPTLHMMRSDSSRQQMYASPPFNTHRFYVELEKSFPSPTATSLMRATRALLVDRIGRVRRDALSSKDLENQAYLFRAALQDSKTEVSLRQKNDSAAIRTTLTTLRREVDALDNKMKTDIATMKHEIQMDVDNRKTESKTELKRQDIAMEDVLHKAITELGALKTLSEEAKWTNMRKSVITLFTFAAFTMIVFEVLPKPRPTAVPPPPLAEPKTPEVAEGLGTMMT